MTFSKTQVGKKVDHICLDRTGEIINSSPTKYDLWVWWTVNITSATAGIQYFPIYPFLNPNVVKKGRQICQKKNKRISPALKATLFQHD